MEVGGIVAGRYRIEAFAGAGGMCSVFRARDRERDRVVALKALHEHAVDADERFAREVRMLQDLRHPSIVRYLDSGTTKSGQRYLVMEWLQGSDLEHLLRDRSLTVNEVLTLASRTAHALGAAHLRGVIHRDVKPSNIFVVADDVHDTKLLDFGVARWGGGGRSLTLTGASVGTPAYMAPEQVRGDRDIDARADVFALGCVIYECLTGEPAFVAHNPMAVFCKILVDKSPRLTELVPGLPPAVDQLLQAMLAKDPRDRPRDGAEVAAAVDIVAQHLDVDAGAQVAPRHRTRRRTITSDEQRLVNVIVAGAGTAMVDGEARTVRLFPARIPAVEFSATNKVSVRFDALSDGSLVAVLEARGVATDQAMNAARFALALRGEFPEGDIALATGLAVVGRTKLVGEAIDRACNLLGRTTRTGYEGATPRPIRLDDVTAGLIGTRFEIVGDEHGLLLLGEQPVPTERTLLGRSTPFVGRTRDLAVLTSTLDECLESGVARAVLVSGPAGSGKTRLLRELLKQVDAHGELEVWLGQGDAMRTGSALDLMAEAVRRLAGVLDGEPSLIARQKLRARVTRSVPEDQVARVTEFLGELIRIAPSSDDSVPLRAARQDPLLMGDQLRRALEDLLDAETRRHPVLIILEDLHWGDLATISFIDRVLRTLSERRLMVVGLARPELHDKVPRIWAAHSMVEVRLGPLSRRAAQTLVESVLGTAVPPDRLAELIDRADGNPFYLEELVRSAANGTWVLPETVLAMMQARIEALEPDARRALRAASLFGNQFWRGGVAALTGDDPSLERWLDVLVERELISYNEECKFAGERAYRFRHNIVRDAAYALLVDADRCLGHRLAAEWLESAGESDARTLAEHFERGEAFDRALPLYVRAAESALERGDFAAVLVLATHAERCGASGSTHGLIRALQGDAHYWRGEHGEAERRYCDAVEELEGGSSRFYDTLGHLMIVWGATEATERMEAFGRKLLADTDPAADRIGRLVAQAIAASRLFLGGSLSLAADLLSVAEAAAGDLGAAGWRLAASLHRARAARGLVRDGDPAAFLREMELGAARFEEIGDMRETLWQRANIGYAFYTLGLWDEAERELASVVTQAEKAALDYVAYGARSNLGIVLARRGEVREALALEQRAQEWFEQRGDHRMAGGSRIYLAMILMVDGDVERAEREARAAVAWLSPGTQGHARAVLATVLLARGAIAEALDESTQAIRQLASSAIYEGEGTMRLVQAEALRASGQHAAARAAIAAARDRLLERAEHIGDEAWRKSFLKNIPDHARTLALAREWGAGVA